LMDENQENGVKINLISRRKLDTMSSEEKLRFILDEIKKGTVLVLERGLTAVEEIDLIKATMNEIDHETFIGIEMQSYSSDDLETESWFTKLLGRAKVPRMSVIGPANLLKTIHKNGTMVQAMILTGKSVVDNISEKGEGEGESEASEIEGLEGEGDSEIDSEIDGDSEKELDGIPSGEYGLNEESGEESEYSDTSISNEESSEEPTPEPEQDITEEDSEVEHQDYPEDSMGFNYSEPEESSSYTGSESMEAEQYPENRETESYTESNSDLDSDTDTYTPAQEPEPVPTPDYTTESSDTYIPPPDGESGSEPESPQDRYESHDSIPFARPVNEDPSEEPHTYESENRSEEAMTSNEVTETNETTEPTGPTEITETPGQSEDDEASTSFLYKRLKQEED